MIILIVFGIVQDVIFHAPFGSFEVINLMTYAASTAIASEFDVTNEPLIAIVSTVMLFTAAFLLLWLMASTLEDHPVRALPLVAAMLTTGLLYALLNKVFDLGRKPGEMVGQAT
jgi:cell shape-determining protein MreD